MGLTILKEAPDKKLLSEVGKRYKGHLPSQVFNQPAWDDAVFSVTRKWWMTFFLRKKFGERTETNCVWHWVEAGKWFKLQEIKEAVAGAHSLQVCIVLNETLQYFVCNDIIDLGYQVPGCPGLSVQGMVVDTMKDTASGCQKIVVDLIDSEGTIAGVVDPAVWFPPGNDIALLTNAFGECFEKPKCRMHTPNKYSGCTQKISTCFSICDDASRTKLWFKTGNGNYYWTEMEKAIAMEQHNMAVDNAILFGQKSKFQEEGTPYEGTTTEGLWTSIVTRGSLMSTVGAPTMDDLNTILCHMRSNSNCDSWTAILSPSKFKDIQKSLKDCFVNSGALSYGVHNANGDSVGLNFNKYSLGGNSMTFMVYDGFSDRDWLPKNAGGVDFDKVIMLCCDDAQGLNVVYQVNSKGQRFKSWLDERAGHTMAEDHKPTLDRACKEWQWTTIVGVEAKGVCRNGAVICE